MRKKVIIIIIVLLLAAGGLFMFFNKNKKNLIMDGPEMVYEETFDFSETYLKYFDYRKTNGESGEDVSVELSIIELEDGSPETTVEYFNRPYLGAKEDEKTVKFSCFIIKNVSEMIETSHMKEWTDLPESEYFVLDGPNIRVSFEYSDGTYISFDNNEEVPDWDAVNKIVDYIKMNIGVKDN